MTRPYLRTTMELIRILAMQRLRILIVQTIVCITAVGLLFWILSYWKNVQSPLELKLKVPVPGFNSSRTAATWSKENYTDLEQLFSAGNFYSAVNRLEQKSLLLQKYVYFRHLTPPPTTNTNVSQHLYGNYRSPTLQQNYMNSANKEVAILFKDKKNGTFVEMGLFKDDVYMSNTLFLETTLGWTGLLVDCNPMTLPFLRMKNRKAWIADACLSPTNYPTMLTVNYAGVVRLENHRDANHVRVSENKTRLSDRKYYKLPAVPLFSILAAINKTKVDFFSLNSQGMELEILRSIPWKKVSITTILINGERLSRRKIKKIEEFLGTQTYSLHQQYDWDWMYLHSSYQK